MLDDFRNKLNEIFAGLFEDETQVCTVDEHQCQLTSAALMIEVASIDQNFSTSELEALNYILRCEFGLTDNQVQDLIALAQSARDDASSLYPFTKLINDQFDVGQKYKLITSMWQVAFADDNLDKYEESIIRRVADLIYLPHSDFIRAKHQAIATQKPA